MAQKTNAYPWYSPRFWHGMRIGDYAGLLARHRFRISPTRWGMAAAISSFSVFNSVSGLTQRVLYGGRVQAVELEHPPVFIIGHWRSGTTLLHEYLVKDSRLGFPSTYQCFAPTHFLLTEWLFPKLFGFVLPSRRPMDDMATGFDRPQEDEFALCALGAPTPYVRMAFPNDQAEHLEFLDMDGCRPDDQKRFEAALEWFVKAVSLRSGGKRLVLKSPPHTGRIELLSRLFPGARFIHITRHPFEIFPSTQRLWRSLDQAQGFQLPRYDDQWLNEYVLTCFERMYAGFQAQEAKVPAGHLIEVRYEDLVREPLSTIERVYERSELGDFAPARPEVEAFIKSQREYRPNRHQLEPELARQVRDRWAFYFERYGYEE